MSQPGGKTTRERKRRISDPAPYKKPSKAPSPMPTTRHSPTRPATPTLGPAAEPSAADVLRELAQLRRSIETKFTESSTQVVNLKAELLSKLDDNDQAVSEVQLAITDVTLSVDQNQRAIHEVRAEVERREIELPQKVKAIVQEALSKTNGGSTTSPARGQRPRYRGTASSQPPLVDLEEVEAGIAHVDKKGEAYERARRSLRLWPVSREGDLKERVVEFMVNELRLDQQHAAGLNFSAKRVGGTRQPGAAAGVKDEVLLAFDSVGERDDVRTFAKNLERRGRGLRLEIPDHLWPSFRALQSIRYELKQKNENLKRNIRFDDENKDLKLDVCLDGEWRTIFPEGARHSLSKLGRPRPGRNPLSHDELDGLLAGEMETQEADA